MKTVWVMLFALFVSQEVFATNSLQFFGTPTNDDHRVKIQVDDPSNGQPGPPADIGSEDFTLEFWMKTTSGNNSTGGGNSCGQFGGANNNWIYGNIIFDRDRFNQGRNFGLSIANGVLRFGTMNTSELRTICGTTTVTDGQWHHVAIQRRRSDGFMSIYVDGNLDVQADGPNGDISYPDNGVPNGGYSFSDPYLVIGAEKHDANFSAFPSYFGYIDEVQLSNTLRYPGSVPTAPFIADLNTVALYHFDEGSGPVVNDTSGAAGGPSNGDIRPGVVWSTETPFSGAPSPGTIRLTVSNANVGEADGTYDFTVTRSGGAGPVTVDYLIGDTGSTATSGSDYQVTAQAASGTLMWADGDTSSRTLTIDIIDDTDPAEGDETIELTLSAPTGGASLGTSSATLTILDNDAPGTLQFAQTNQTADENAGTATITVNRTNGTSGTVTVAYTVTGGSATADVDYGTIQPISGTLTFQDGETAATITVPVLNDSEEETLETVNFSLSSPSGGASLGGRDSMVLVIIDDDSPLTIGGSGAYNPLFLTLMLLLSFVGRRYGTNRSPD